MRAFTDAALRNMAPPKLGQITLKEDSSPLRVRLSQGGSVTFFVTLDGSGRRHTIGRFGDISLSQAREAARTLRAEKTLGRVIPKPVAVAEARERYLKQAEISDATYDYYQRHLNKLTGKVGNITPRDLTNILDTLPGPSRLQATRTYSAFFNWCITQHYIDRSPAERMGGGKDNARDRVLTDAELRAIWQATEAPCTYHSIVRLCITLGRRKNEIAKMRDTWIEGDCCTFPREVCKNRITHLLPLGHLSQSLIPRTKGLLFPSTEGTVFSAWSKNKTALDAAAKIEHYELRDLRRTYRTLHSRIRTPPHIAERLVHHVSDKNDLELVYDRWDYWDEKKEAQYHYERHLSSILGLR